MALYDPQHHRSQAFVYGQDPDVICRCFAAKSIWMLGYPDQALQRIHEALTLAQELTHPFSLAIALTFVAVVHQFRREVQAVQERRRGTDSIIDRAGFSALVGLWKRSCEAGR